MVQADINWMDRKRFELSGDGVVKDGSTKVLVNGATYFLIINILLFLRRTSFFDNVTITDENGTTGKVNGKLFHNTHILKTLV